MPVITSATPYEAKLARKRQVTFACSTGLPPAHRATTYAAGPAPRWTRPAATETQVRAAEERAGAAR
eukprot:1200540-Alexandrium_andersonii.AAC.1